MIDEVLLKKVRNVKSADELMKSAAKEGINLDKKEAGKYFDLLCRKGEMSDDELGSVSGGGCGDITRCPACGIGEPLYRSCKDGKVRIACTHCPVELDYAGGRYFVISDYFER